MIYLGPRSIFYSVTETPFCLKMLYNIYCMTSRAILPEYFPLDDRKALACYVTLCLRHRVT
jgi:hypothetical protein